MLSRLAGGLAVAAVASVVTVAALEVAVRIVAPQDLTRDEGLFTADAGRSFKLTPGFRGAEVSDEFNVPIVISADGLRDRVFARPKPAGVIRILVLGDSFTYGGGARAEDTYPKRLEARLNARSDGRRWEVVNAGISGYGTFHEARFLREEGWSYQPDVLILQVFLDNDLAENLYPFAREVRGGFLRFKSERPGPAWRERLKEFLRRRSHLYRVVGDRWNLLRIRFGWEPFYAASLGVYERTPPPDVARGWEATRRYLREIAAAARERGVGLLVVHAPKNVALDARLQRAFMEFHRAPAASLDWELPARRLGELCRADGLACLDLTPRFKATGRPLDFYHPRNGHWNPAGHERVAAWILERLVTDGVQARAGGQPAPAAR